MKYKIAALFVAFAISLSAASVYLSACTNVDDCKTECQDDKKRPLGQSIGTCECFCEEWGCVWDESDGGAKKTGEK